MAVASGSKQKEGKMKSPTKKRNKESQEQSEKVISTPAKRNNCPGVRLVGGRIYDSFNGKTCHQVLYLLYRP